MQREVNIHESWEDYVAMTERPRASWAPNHSETNPAKESWDLGLGLEGSRKLAREGWMKHYAEVEGISEHVESQVDTELFQTAFEANFDVAGAEVDMGRFLSGEPECMIEATPIRISRHGRAVRIVVPIGYSAGTDSRQVLIRGAAVVALADLLTKTQHPLEVWAAVTLTTEASRANKKTGKADYVDLIRIQAPTDALDVGRLLYVLAHPGCFRRLGFRGVEVQASKAGWSKIGSHYGYPIGFDPGDLPDQAENTIVLDHLNYRDRWDEAYAAAWVQEQLERIFG